MPFISRIINTVKLAATPTSSIAAKNDQLFIQAEIRPEKAAELNVVAGRVLAGKARYETVAATMANGIPWWFIGIAHFMEAGAFKNPFLYHLHCGDPLTARTVHVPKGRPIFNPKNGTQPPSIQNPYTWEESALDALKLSGYDKIKDWSIGNCLWLWEKFNGTGYRKRGMLSPYVWSYTTLYGTPPNIGKFVADGKFDPNAVSKQAGTAAILKALHL